MAAFNPRSAFVMPYTDDRIVEWLYIPLIDRLYPTPNPLGCASQILGAGADDVARSSCDLRLLGVRKVLGRAATTSTLAVKSHLSQSRLQMRSHSCACLQWGLSTHDAACGDLRSICMMTVAPVTSLRTLHGEQHPAASLCGAPSPPPLLHPAVCFQPSPPYLRSSPCCGRLPLQVGLRARPRERHVRVRALHPAAGGHPNHTGLRHALRCASAHANAAPDPT